MRPSAKTRARRDETRLTLRLQLGDRLEIGVVEDPVRQVELGLDVRLLGPRPEVAGVAARAEQEPERLREDRLPRAGLAGDRVQAGHDGQLRVADEHEVLDAEASQRYENTSL